MAVRVHSDFGAYCFPAPALEEARLFSLKLECVEVSGVRRRYVDALLLNGPDLIPVPFIYIAEDGDAVLHEQHQMLHPHVREWLSKTVREWVATKPSETNLEADLFDKDEALRSEVLSAADTQACGFAGLSPYSLLFTEAERYANLTPWVLGKSAIDFTPGLGYGPRTLAAASSSLFVHEGTLTGLTRRIRPKLATPQEKTDVAIHLGIDPSSLSAVVKALRAVIRPGGTAIVSVRSDEEPQALRSAGADVLRMSRPGCDGLGALGEWMGIFRDAPCKPMPAAEPPADTQPARVSARPLRVLFGLRPSAKAIFGGDVVQVRETASALRERGHFVEISTEPSLDASGFDIVHLTNMTVPPETLPQARSVAAFDGAVVLMPIFTDHCDETVWGMNVSTSLYLAHQDRDDLRKKLDLLEARALSIAGLPSPPQRAEMIEGYTPMQKETLGLVDFVIANAHSEMHRVFRYLTCEVPYAVVPSCANPTVYGTHARARFVDRFGLEDFVLLAGRYEPRKNQLNFFEAAREMGLPLLFIGNNYNPAFGTVVRMHRPGKAAYIGHLPEGDLAGAFAAARVVAIPSWDEVVSLTSLNAAISAASMVLTRNSYEHEYFADDAEYCDPGSVRSIASALRRAWDSHEARARRRAFLRERVVRDFNWQRSAALTEEAYYRVLQFNPRRERRLSRAAGTPGRN